MVKLPCCSKSHHSSNDKQQRCRSTSASLLDEEDEKQEEEEEVSTKSQIQLNIQNEYFICMLFLRIASAINRSVHFVFRMLHEMIRFIRVFSLLRAVMLLFAVVGVAISSDAVVVVVVVIVLLFFYFLVCC